MFFSWSWIFSLSFPFLSSSSPKSLRVCGLLWGGAAASGDYPLAYTRVKY